MGLDSSVIAGLFSGISGIKPIALILPCESSPDDERIAKTVLKHFKIPWIKVDLTDSYRYLKNDYSNKNKVDSQLEELVTKYGDSKMMNYAKSRERFALWNIKVRLRMTTLYHVAQLTGGVVVSTDNFSEWWMGFWTLNGDVGDFSPIQQIFKGIELYEIARALGVPKESIDAKPTDGLNIVPGGGDEDQLGLPYDKLDPVIIELLKADYDNWNVSRGDKGEIALKIAKKLNYPLDKITHIANQMRNTYFKRRVPVQVKRENIGLPEISKL